MGNPMFEFTNLTKHPEHRDLKFDYNEYRCGPMLRPRTRLPCAILPAADAATGAALEAPSMAIWIATMTSGRSVCSAFLRHAPRRRQACSSATQPKSSYTPPGGPPETRHAQVRPRGGKRGAPEGKGAVHRPAGAPKVRRRRPAIVEPRPGPPRNPRGCHSPGRRGLRRSSQLNAQKLQSHDRKHGARGWGEPRHQPILRPRAVKDGWPKRQLGRRWQ